MIIDYVVRQLTRRRRVKNGLRYRDDFTPTYQKFLRLCRQIDKPGARIPVELRRRVEDLKKHNRRAINFRLMKRVERKAAGCGPRMLAEPSEELKAVINQVEEHLAKKPAPGGAQESEQRARFARAAVGLAAKGH